MKERRVLILIAFVALTVLMVNSTPVLIRESGEDGEDFITESGQYSESFFSGAENVADDDGSYKERLDDSLGCETYEKQYHNDTEDVVEIIKLDCGGIVSLPHNKSSVLLSYKASHTHGREDRCLWSLDESQDGQKFLIKIKVTMLCEGTGDVLSVLKWDVLTGLNPHEISRETLDYSSDYGDGFFLSFNSNGDSNGFIVRVDVVGIFVWYAGLNLAHTTTPGRESYGPFDVGEQISVIINPPNIPTSFTVDYVDTFDFGACYYHDSIHVYEIGKKGSTNSLGRLCGNMTTPVTYTSEFPLLALFWTSDPSEGRGFGISWK